MPQAISLHIGLNHVDPNAYGSWDGALRNCINDANDMQSLATAAGYQTSRMVDAEASAVAVTGAISDAATRLRNGDILLITYSGHGGQVPDSNGDEPDSQDETWVLWDRMLIDDELYALWSQFESGVRVLVLSDSCHSGTVVRATYGARGEAQLSIEEGPKPREQRVLWNALAGSEDTRAKARAGLSMRDAGPPKTRNIALDAQIASVQARSSEYTIAQLVAGASSRATIRAAVMLISGCQDNQLSSDGTGNNGLFTGTLLSTWNGGSFDGDYSAFHQAIRSQMPSIQSPNHLVLGSDTDPFRGQRPFTIAAPGGVAVSVPAQPGQPAVASTQHRQLQSGDQGPQVSELQRLLNEHGYALSVDGQFGWRTDGAVRDFQGKHGLARDGIVGQQTWAALLDTGSDRPTTEPSPGMGAGAGGAPTSSDVALEIGDEHDKVMELTQLLKDIGYAVTVQRFFSKGVQSAVAEFQTDKGLEPTGKVGPETWSALRSSAPRPVPTNGTGHSYEQQMGAHS